MFNIDMKLDGTWKQLDQVTLMGSKIKDLVRNLVLAEFWLDLKILD